VQILDDRSGQLVLILQLALSRVVHREKVGLTLRLELIGLMEDLVAHLSAELGYLPKRPLRQASCHRATDLLA
jgi:hypothetical protein